ncbi:MAG: hypothetical protein IJR40_10660, partial [Treponema sp.]|nr:hypothetical protein [Treponema sp.]
KFFAKLKCNKLILYVFASHKSSNFTSFYYKALLQKMQAILQLLRVSRWPNNATDSAKRMSGLRKHSFCPCRASGRYK